MAIKNMNLLQNRYPNTFEVYLISDLQDKPLYVGQGQFGIRARQHLCPSNAIKFNRKSSEIKILFKVIVATKEEALDLEEKFIERFKPEFNKAKRDTSFGCKHSEETKKKISIAIRDRNLGSHHSEETKKKISLSSIGKTISDETRHKMSESAKKGWLKRNK